MNATDYIARAQAALKAGFTTKQAQQDALADVTRAYEAKAKAIRDELLEIAHEDRSEDWNTLYWGLADYPHNWKARHSELFAKAGFGVIVNEIEAIVRFRAVVKEASVNKAAPKPAPAPSVEEGRMTCQVCGRPILANTGKIAHHGYTRPGFGWQTASCEGATHVPFEVSRDALEAYIANLNRVHDRLVARQDTITSGYAKSASLYVTNYDAPHQYGRQRGGRLITVTPETFETVRDELPKTFKMLSLTSFEVILEGEARTIKGQLSQLLSELAQQEVRYEGWSQTHSWNGSEFTAI